ncbi:MAG: type 1 glutamine amidotransferase [Proteobacteria bacterium]|nr:type 1 glutamine amidotransferase [Pseudomonadota bacterium]MBU1709066.1 type 1 glutamine amidotransferase [Pseudomonadota bacterium]
MKKFLMFQHMEWEGPGKFLLRCLDKHGISHDIVRIWEQPVPDNFSEYSALIVLGGGPNVDQEEMYPFLVQEKTVIRKALDLDMPYLGFCLGHQLLAHVLGAEVGPNFCTSIGYTQGHLTHDGREHPVFQNLPVEFPLFKWHGQSVKTPVRKNISILITSEECQVEAISVPGRPHIIGLQFDNHSASRKDIALWLEKDRQWIFSAPDREVNPTMILSMAKLLEKNMEQDFDILFNNFIRLL